MVNGLLNHKKDRGKTPGPCDCCTPYQVGTSGPADTHARSMSITLSPGAR
ncbi:MAG: hypothetical protein JWN15_1238 [Firmicutes bacterium]|nr:hypothetical protein [Bacillota bacterium]